jgi:hypothetical protein
MSDPPKLPESLEKMIDKVLAYKPKAAKATGAKKRKQAANKKTKPSQ